jgi:hypothetical protein
VFSKCFGQHEKMLVLPKQNSERHSLLHHNHGAVGHVFSPILELLRDGGLETSKKTRCHSGSLGKRKIVRSRTGKITGNDFLVTFILSLICTERDLLAPNAEAFFGINEFLNRWNVISPVVVNVMDTLFCHPP